MATCQFCETEIPDGLRVCPRCGTLQPTPQEQRQRNRNLMICICLVLLMIFVASAIHGRLPHF